MDYFVSNYFSLVLDPLSLLFLACIGVVALPALLYSVGYLRGQFSLGRTVLLHILTALFLASMALVVTAGNILLFLFAWECMSLISYFLVVFEHEHQKSVKAGLIYAVMTHVGTAFLLVAFLLLHRYAGSFEFEAVKAACGHMPAYLRHTVFILLLIGFGTKAGIVPVHVWLPYAHPQAPSHISSLMSGVMIKTAVYGLIRFVVGILGVYDAWWGIVILSFAAASALIGIVYALMEHDIKRLLAYSSVENIGIVLMGVGAAVLCLGLNNRDLAVLALAAGLYHAVNHGIFKSLLFLCAGSIVKGTKTRDMEKLGGLIHKMPQTAACFLVGAMAISAIPPLNGFVSEWLTLQTFFLGARVLPGAEIKFFLGACACALALTGGLAASCFVKAFGITFLAQPRSNYAVNACESPLTMRLAMIFLAALCVAFGIFSAPVLNIMAGVAGHALGTPVPVSSFALNAFVIQPAETRDVYVSAPLLAVLLAFFAAGAAGLYALGGRRRETLFKTWDCGYYALDARNQYTATAFSKPFRIAFSFLLLPYRRTQKIRESFYHVKSFVYETRTTWIFLRYFYKPVLALGLRSARIMRRMQTGSIHLYLGYVFLTVMILLVMRNAF